MRPLTLCLIGGSISNAARGQLALAEQQTAEGRELARALGWTASQLASFSATRVLAFRGNRKSLRRAIADGRTIAATRGIGDMIRVAHASRSSCTSATANIPRPTRRQPAIRRQDTIGLTAEALQAVVEAGLRSGHAAEAAAALTELERHATASGTGWALGLLARSAALLAPPPGRSRRALPEGHRPPGAAPRRPPRTWHAPTCSTGNGCAAISTRPTPGPTWKRR